jgi:hypothetical protein
MKKIKLMTVGLVLTLTGAVFAFSGSQTVTDTCPLVKMGCPLCKAKK